MSGSVSNLRPALVKLRAQIGKLYFSQHHQNSRNKMQSPERNLNYDYLIKTVRIPLNILSKDITFIHVHKN